MDDQKNILKIENVSKSFGFVKALSDVSFSVRSGEIHALLGENGAGKSTLIKILAGDLIPDEGSVCIDGTKVETYHPTIARNLGISVVHQELSVFENMLVYENIFPYNSDSQFVIPKKELIRRAADAIERFRLPLSPTARVGDLRLSVQQMVEILRALSDNAKIILLDEPTSGLNENEAALLKGILTSLRAEGITIIYISHRISEIMGLCDRITVLRDGQYITTLENNDELTESALVSRMVGREFLGSIYSKKVSRLRSDAEPVLEAKGFSNNATVMDASVSLHHQELLGVFGLEGSGTHEFSRMLFGLQETSLSRR